MNTYDIRMPPGQRATEQQFEFLLFLYGYIQTIIVMLLNLCGIIVQVHMVENDCSPVILAALFTNISFHTVNF